MTDYAAYIKSLRWVFQTTYEGARQTVRNLAEDCKLTVESYAHPGHENLTTDVIRIGPPPGKVENVIVLTSGVHGAEGPAGSALICLILTLYREGLLELPPNTALVLVHSVNPYGQAHVTRTNADNVDINRNNIGHENPPQEHYLTQTIHEILNPEDGSQPDPDTLVERIVEAVTPVIAEKYGMKEEEEEVPIDLIFQEVQAALTQGQYGHADGLYYGGTEPAPETKILSTIIARHCKNASSIVMVDVHTGVGDPGNHELIADSYDLQNIAFIWGLDQYEYITIEGDGASAPTTGDLSCLLDPYRDDGVNVAYITLEYGTVDPVAVLMALVQSNEARKLQEKAIEENRGFTAEEILVIEEAEKAMNNAFNPSDPEWQQNVLETGLRVLQTALESFWKPEDPAPERKPAP